MTEAARARPVLLGVTVGLLSLAADAVTKAWALSALHDGHQIDAPGGVLRLQLVLNHGAAFGLGAGLEPLIAVASIAGVVLFGLWARHASGRLERIGAALAAGGAAGNLLDRLIRPPRVLHGAVTDWIHVSFYGPAFNLADVWLRGGVLVAAAGWLWAHRTRQHNHAPEPAQLLARMLHREVAGLVPGA